MRLLLLLTLVAAHSLPSPASGQQLPDSLQLPKLDTDTEKGLSACTKVLKGGEQPSPDDQTWYTYFTCVEKELFKHKVVSKLLLSEID